MGGASTEPGCGIQSGSWDPRVAEYQSLMPHRPQVLSLPAGGLENLTPSHTFFMSNVGNLPHLSQAKGFCRIIQVWLLGEDAVLEGGKCPQGADGRGPPIIRM